jgi:hypothetical protein
MKIRALTFGDRETRDEAQIPETVTVEMSIEEAVILADTAGNVLGEGQQQTSTLIWNGLVPLINQTWEDGVTEAMRDLGLHRWLFKQGTRDHA